MLYVPSQNSSNTNRFNRGAKDVQRQFNPTTNGHDNTIPSTEHPQKQTFTIEVELDLDILDRVDKVYFDYIKQTQYYKNTFTTKQQDKLIAFQILFRCALLKKLILCSSVRSETLISQNITQDLLHREFHVPIALHSLINCFGQFTFEDHCVRIKHEIHTINSIAADIVRLCAQHTGIARHIPDTHRDSFESLKLNKVHFLDQRSNRELQNQATAVLGQFYKEEIVINLATGECRHFENTDLMDHEILVTYPILEICKNRPAMLSNYKNWIRKLSPEYPDFRQLLLVGAVFLCEKEWFLNQNLHRPIYRLVKDLDFLKEYTFKPKDILDYFCWKAIHTNQHFETLLHFALELCKGQVFKDMLHTKLSSFSNIGNTAQLVVHNINQNGQASSNFSPRLDDLPRHDCITIGHLFGITKQVTYKPMSDGKAEKGAEVARKEFLCRDFRP